MNTIVSSYLKICTDIGTHPIPELLSCLSAGIKSCSISSPNETLPDGQVIALCAVVPLSSLEELCFHNLALNINSWVAIADSCSKCKSLQKLVLKECNFREGQGVPTFAKTLGNAELQVLDISSCKLGDEFVAALADAAIVRCDKLMTLRMAQCNISCDGICRLAKALESVGMNSSLKVLDLSYNRIGDKGACALAAMLISEGMSSSLPLNSLELEGNQITDVGGLALCRAAKGALVLSRLNISVNNTTDATLLAMADALRFNTGTLKEVAIAGCRAGEDAAVAVIKAATKNNGLQLLDLRGVPLGMESVGKLCQMLRYTATLNTLRVDVMNREGAEIIAKELPNNRSLMHLTIGGPVPEPLLAKMSEILAANTMRHASTSPAHASPHIHAWIENATVASGRPSSPGPYSGYHHSSRSRSPSPGPGRSPRSDAGGSVYSHGTYTTNRTQRTATTYLSFQFSQMSRKTGLSSSPLRISNSLAAGGAAEKAAIIFRKHDVNQDNYLNRDEMLAALQEVGVLNGIRAKQVGRFLDHEFKKADWDNDGKISLQDFISYYEKIAYYQTQMAREGRIKSASHKQQIPAGVENNASLKRVFKNYCKFALGQGRQYNESIPHMNAQQFHRLCQDAGFVEPDGRLSTTAIDVVFYRYRPAGARRLGFREFIEALATVAYEAGLQFEDVMVALGCRGANPLTPDGSARGSEAGGLMGAVEPSLDSAYDPVGAGISNMPSGGLEAIQEVPSALNVGVVGGAAAGIKGAAKSAGAGPKKLKKKKKASGAAGEGPGVVVGNPLFESVEGNRMIAAAAAAVSSASTVEMKALESRLASMEAKLMSQEQLSRYAESARNQDVSARITKLETSVNGAVVRQEELDSVSRQMADLQGILGKLAEEITSIKLRDNVSAATAAPAAGTASLADVAALSRRVDELTSTLSGAVTDLQSLSSRVDTMQLQLSVLSSESRSMGGARSTVDLDSMAAMEKKFMDRQGRFEGALMQVARQVDVLDSRLREEQEASLKALETILNQAGLPGMAGVQLTGQ